MKPITLPNSFLKARRALLLDHPFFGSLIMNLEPVIDPTCKSIWVNGRKLGFAETFFDALPTLEGAGVLAHELLHCALEHQLRRDDRDPKVWNDACDYVINPMVKKSGLPLPEKVLFNPAYEGQSAEEVYAALNTQKPQSEEGGEGSGDNQAQTSGGGGDGSTPGQNTPQNAPGTPQLRPADGDRDNPTGEVRDAADEDGQAISPAEAREQGEEWKIAVQQAVNNAKGQGFFPAELDHIVTEILKPRVDWREELRRFFQSVSRTDSTWSRPNRRFIGRGLYLPGMRTETAGPLVVGIDTSGSIGSVTLDLFAAELSAIIEDTQPERVYVVYCDAQVHGVEEFTADDLPLQLHPRGGGGTRFEPVFDWVESTGVQPDALVYLTDTYGSFPAQAPDYPVLWATTAGTHVPFGEVIQIKGVF
jgi:predicted metal-dependent peptidase